MKKFEFQFQTKLGYVPKKVTARVIKSMCHKKEYAYLLKNKLLNRTINNCKSVKTVHSIENYSLEQLLTKHPEKIDGLLKASGYHSFIQKAFSWRYTSENNDPDYEGDFWFDRHKEIVAEIKEESM